MKLTTKQKAKLRDNLQGWIEVSLGYENDRDDAIEAIESIKNYTLGIYASLYPNLIIEDRDVDYVCDEGTYDNQTRGMLTPIQDDVFMYGYKGGKESLK